MRIIYMYALLVGLGRNPTGLDFITKLADTDNVNETK